MNLKDYIPEAYIPAIITASVALIVGVGAQFLNSWLTARRENKKYRREIYEEFISEFFVDILTYVSVKTQPRSDHDVKLDVKDISTTVENMFKKIHYGDRHLQSLNLAHKTSSHLEDFKGDSQETLQIKIFYFFLIYSKKIFKKTSFKLDKSVKFQLDHSIREYAYWYIYAETRDFHEAPNKLKSLTMCSEQILQRYSLKYFRKLIIGDDLQANEQFLKKIDKKIEKGLS
ncbi:hypothetical protein ACMX9J_14285 [Priestia sp. RMT2NF4]|uniref:hypothetical protein n=1 Tax=Priestia sp. RMT2NF4 TaxID=3398394 RepID=UPI003A4C7C43